MYTLGGRSWIGKGGERFDQGNKGCAILQWLVLHWNLLPEMTLSPSLPDSTLLFFVHDFHYPVVDVKCPRGNIHSWALIAHSDGASLPFCSPDYKLYNAQLACVSRIVHGMPVIVHSLPNTIPSKCVLFADLYLCRSLKILPANPFPFCLHLLPR